MTISFDDKIDIAIVGAGPGGLAAAIFLSRLPFVRLSVFEQASELREVGAGISINENTWRLLKLLGADQAIEQNARRGVQGQVDSQQRNGRTGELLLERHQRDDPHKPARSRIERYKLQRALLSRLPLDLIQLDKKLLAFKETPKGVYLEFKTGVSGPFQLVIGADGIRSRVRAHAFPDHKLSYTGKVAFRTLIPQSKVAHLDLPRHSTFWHNVDTHIYTDFLDNGLFEIATRAIEPEEHGTKVSWGQKVPKDKVIHHYKAVIDVPDSYLEFAMFGGPRLRTVVSGDHIALLGDSSHPLSGAFGSGAAFAFEDAFVLAEALRLIHEEKRPLSDALKIYDEVRGPRYQALHGVLDQMAGNIRNVRSLELFEDEHIAESIKRNWALNNAWIYTYNIADVWEEYLRRYNDSRHSIE